MKRLFVRKRTLGSGRLAAPGSVRAFRGGRHYETSIDRVGHGLVAGGAIGGLIVMLLMLAAGQMSPLALVIGALVGAALSMPAIALCAGPLWLVLHLSGRRGPVSAALAGMVAAGSLFMAGQTYGFGLFAAPVTDSRTLLYRWVSAGASSAVLAIIAALIGLVIWRVAYRRVL